MQEYDREVAGKNSAASSVLILITSPFFRAQIVLFVCDRGESCTGGDVKHSVIESTISAA